MKFSIKDFFSKYDQIRRFLRVWSHLLKKFLTENFIFCAVVISSPAHNSREDSIKEPLIFESTSVTMKLSAKYWRLFIYWLLCSISISSALHCVKRVQIWSFFWSMLSCIRTEYKKIRTRKNSAFGHFPRSVSLYNYILSVIVRYCIYHIYSNDEKMLSKMF